jgi:prepilin-type N-terminal cleavage/methylation domain-containing protein
LLCYNTIDLNNLIRYNKNKIEHSSDIKMKKFINKVEGFTLIELMVVILILAILLTIAIPVYLNSTKNAKIRTCQANLRIIDGGVSTYLTYTGSYPTAVDEMVTTGDYQILKKTPTCPKFSGLYSFDTSVPPVSHCPGGAEGESQGHKL